MKLYLSSYRVPTSDNLKALIGGNLSQLHVAVIPNAQDYYADRARDVKIKEVADYLASLGFQLEVVDLRDYDDAIMLAQKLQSYELVWVMGGNTFCLSYEMQRSGFKKAIQTALDSGVVYGGESAGALIAGNSLKGVEFADEPKFAEQIVWETLNLVPSFVLPHVDNEAFAEAIQKAREVHADDPSIFELRDNQALVINGDSQSVTTAPE
jgi:dipeptidase E